jgi:HK97 family phage portal protein
MKWFRRKKEAEVKKQQFETVLERLVAAQGADLSAMVTPDTCMQAPTVRSIVKAVSDRIAMTPIHLYRKTTDSDGLVTKEALPNHPVAKLLKKPNQWQSPVDFWGDATSVLLRHGKFYAHKGRGSTGPIRMLTPIHPTAVTLDQDFRGNVTYTVAEEGGTMRDYSANEIFTARHLARDFLEGDSPIEDCKVAIALEILAEKTGHSLFANGAMPMMVFKFAQGSAGFRTQEQEKEFIRAFQEAFGGGNKHRAMLLPKGIESDDPVRIEQDKNQFIETRNYQRTVIAAAFGVPPHVVGDFSNAHYTNVEQADQDFVTNVIVPIARRFEAAMERDLLTDIDRASGVVIRFNIDAALRADYLSRQEGLRIQREMGVINPNEWREIEGMNPREGGDAYWDEGQQGQGRGTENDEAETDDAA